MDALKVKELGYWYPRLVPGGGWIGLKRERRGIYYVCVGINVFGGYSERFLYKHAQQAKDANFYWQPEKATDNER